MEKETTDHENISWWPLFNASVGAAALSFFGGIASMWLAIYQASVPWSMKFWYVLPYFELQTNVETLNVLLRKSALITSFLLLMWSALAFVTKRRLQVRQGRAFGGLNVFVIGALAWTKPWWSDSYSARSSWMWILMLIGVVSFLAMTALIYTDYTDRQPRSSELRSETRDEPQPMATS